MSLDVGERLSDLLELFADVMYSFGIDRLHSDHRGESEELGILVFLSRWALILDGDLVGVREIGFEPIRSLVEEHPVLAIRWKCWNAMGDDGPLPHRVTTTCIRVKRGLQLWVEREADVSSNGWADVANGEVDQDRIHGGVEVEDHPWPCLGLPKVPCIAIREEGGDR